MISNDMSNKEKELAIIEMKEMTMTSSNVPRGSLDSLPKCKI